MYFVIIDTLNIPRFVVVPASQALAMPSELVVAGPMDKMSADIECHNENVISESLTAASYEINDNFIEETDHASS